MSREQQAQIFMDQMKNLVDSGAFDEEISMPFLSRKLILAAIRTKVNKLLETGGTPLLTDAEITEAVKDAKYTAVITGLVFFRVGIIEKTNGSLKVSEKFEKYLDSFTLS